MRNRSPWILVAALAFLGLLSVSSLPVLVRVLRNVALATLAETAHAQETMKFEPVPAESVAATEHRRAERQAREAERRAAESVSRVLSVPPAPSEPDVPEVPEPPDFSHAGDLVRIGSDIHIERGQVVEGDVFALRGDIRVDGHVKGNVAATGGDVTLGPTARVDGDVMCIGGRLEEEAGARVGGQRVTALRGDRSSDLKGVIRREFGQHDDDEDYGRGVGKVGFALSWLLISMGLAWGIAKFAPTRTGTALESVKQEPGLSLMLGLAIVALLVPSVVAMALVVAILCITIIGIPLALGVMVGYAGLIVVLALWGYVVGVIPVGERFGQRLGRSGGLVTAAVLGTLVVAGSRAASEILHFVPLFGWFANLLWVVAFLLGVVVTLMGAGALMRTRFGQGRNAPWWPLFTRAKAAPAPGTGDAPPPAAPPPPPSPSEPSPAA